MNDTVDPTTKSAKSMQNHMLDETDRKILRAIQGNARASHAEIAARLDLSASMCWRRLRRMQEAGIIRKYATVLASELVGFGVTAFVDVKLDNREQAADRKFRQAVRDCPEVLACFFVAGEADYMLRIVARDLNALSCFLMEKLMQLPGVSRIKTSVTLEEIKNTTELPLT